MDVIATMVVVVEDPLVVILGVIAEGTIIIRFCPLLFEREERKKHTIRTYQPSFADD